MGTASGALGGLRGVGGGVDGWGVCVGVSGWLCLGLERGRSPSGEAMREGGCRFGGRCVGAQVARLMYNVHV